MRDDLDTPINDSSVRESTEFRWKPAQGRKYLVALAPKWASDTELDPDPDLIRQAEAGDNDAVERVRAMARRAMNIREGARSKKPRSLPWELDGRAGYLYFPTVSRMVHFTEDQKGPVLCMSDAYRAAGLIGPTEEGLCCSTEHLKKAEKMTAFLLMVIRCDENGDPLDVPLSQQVRLNDTMRIDFEYSYHGWAAPSNRMTDWSNKQDMHPPMLSDYIVERPFNTSGNFAKWEFNGTGRSLWRSKCPDIVPRLLAEAAPHWPKLVPMLGTELTFDQMVERFAPSGGTGRPTNPNEYRAILAGNRAGR